MLEGTNFYFSYIGLVVVSALIGYTALFALVTSEVDSRDGQINIARLIL